MKNALEKHLYIAFILFSVALTFVLSTWYVHHNQRALETLLREQLEEERSYLAQLAEITDSNGADSITQSIVRDCPRRDEYESFLGNLGALSMRELIAVQTLSESCGMFYAERKALMVAKLERELVHYNTLLDTLALLSGEDFDSFQRTEWNSLVELEKGRSAGLGDQARIQEEIIAALITGESSQSEHVTQLVQQAQEINELLVVQNQRIDEMRSRLVQ